MRWSFALTLGLALAACGGETTIVFIFPDGGTGQPGDPPDDGLPVRDGGVIDADELYPIARSVDDFGPQQGASGWSYGYTLVEDAVAESPAGAGGGAGTTGGGAPPVGAGLRPIPGEFRYLERYADGSEQEPGEEWLTREPLEWLYLGAEGAHPYGPVTSNGRLRQEIWPMRRWRAPWSGSFYVRVRARSRRDQAPCPHGDGTWVALRRGADVIERTYVPGPDLGTPVEWSLVPVSLRGGDTIDVTVEPGTNDLCDATSTEVEIFERVVVD